jgi:hypothetical protein
MRNNSSHRTIQAVKDNPSHRTIQTVTDNPSHLTNIHPIDRI